MAVVQVAFDHTGEIILTTPATFKVGSDIKKKIIGSDQKGIQHTERPCSFEIFFNIKMKLFKN
jgi:hypothetical protein